MKQNIITISEISDSFISCTSISREASTIDTNRAAGKA